MPGCSADRPRAFDRKRPPSGPGGMLLEDQRTSCRLERIALGGEGLRVGGDPGVADQRHLQIPEVENRGSIGQGEGG